MFKRLAVVCSFVAAMANTALAAENNIHKVQAKIISVQFCSTERESVCVKTNKGQLILMSPYSGAIDGDSFKELFFDLHLMRGESTTLIIEKKDEIVGVKTPHWEFLAPEIVGKELKPRKMP